MPDRVAPLEAEPARHVDVADDPFLDPLLRLVEPELSAGAVLHDPVVLPRRRDDLLRLEHVVRDRLLDEHILAGLDRPDRLQRVVEVRSRDRHGVDASIVEHPPDVRERSGRFFPAASIVLQPLSMTAWSTSQSAAISTLGIFR